MRKRAKQIVTLLTMEDHINTRKNAEKMKEKSQKKENVTKSVKIKKEKEKQEKTRYDVKRKAIRRLSHSSDNSSTSIPLSILPEKNKKQKLDENDNCRGCSVNYYETVLKEDWLQCTVCHFWVYEHCTPFENMCSRCGRVWTRKKKIKLKN